MMDDQSTKIRAMLDERGVKWTEKKIDNAFGKAIVTEWNGNKSSFIEWNDGKCHFTSMASIPNCTPEQAVAATLGDDESYNREECESAFVRGYSLGSLPVGSDPQWDENMQTVDEHMAELGWVRAATLGSGKLTAEQVREAIEANSLAETSTIREFSDSAWQAIADELNAMGGGR